MTRSHIRSQPVPRIERLIGENGPVPHFPSNSDKMPQQRQVRRSHTKRARSQLSLGNGPVSHTHPTWYVHDTVIALTTSLRSGPVVDTPTQFQRVSENQVCTAISSTMEGHEGRKDTKGRIRKRRQRGGDPAGDCAGSTWGEGERNRQGMATRKGEGSRGEG